MIQIDYIYIYNIFQMGWFNHQLVLVSEFHHYFLKELFIIIQKEHFGESNLMHMLIMLRDENPQKGCESSLGFCKNSGTPKWMVYMENLIKMDDLGVPLFSETSVWVFLHNFGYSLRRLQNSPRPGFGMIGCLLRVLLLAIHSVVFNGKDLLCRKGLFQNNNSRVDF